MDDFEKLEAKLMEKEAFREAYEKLEPEYQSIESEILAQRQE